jgi:hypothetical protein
VSALFTDYSYCISIYLYSAYVSSTLLFSSGIVNKCMVQDPRQRAKIVDIFEDLMTLIIDHGLASTTKHSSQGHGPETNGSLNSMSGPPSVEPRNVSAVLLSMKTFLSSRPITRWSNSKAFNVVQWSKEVSKLRPRSLDFRCGSGLVITLLSDDSLTVWTPTNWPSPTADTQSQSLTQTQRRPFSLRSSSSIDSSRAPYISPSLLCRDFSQDLTHELKGRIDAASRMIATASLSTCARTLVQKTVVRSVRDDGVFHIEISCGSRPGQEETADVRNHQQLRGIERLVLPMSKTGDVLDEESEAEYLDDMYSDAAVVKAVDRILQLAQVTLSAAVPPAILITVVPYIPFATGAIGHVQYCVYLLTLLLTLCLFACLFVCQPA